MPERRLEGVEAAYFRLVNDRHMRAVQASEALFVQDCKELDLDPARIRSARLDGPAIVLTLASQASAPEMPPEAPPGEVSNG